MTSEDFILVTRGPSGDYTLAGSSRFEAGLKIPNSGGIHAEWRWDGVQLQAGVDRYGISPLFYAHGPNWIALSPSLRKLLSIGVPSAIDPQAIGGFLLHGHFLGESTPFLAIKALPPSGRLIWTADRFSCLGARPKISAAQLSGVAAEERYLDLFVTAMERHLAAVDDFELPITGGRDSRFILFESLRQGKPPTRLLTAQYYSHDTEEDTRIARLVASATGLPHDVVYPYRRYIPAQIVKNAKLDWLASEHTYAITMAGALAQRRPVIFDGLNGSVFAAGAFLDKKIHRLMVTGQYDAAADALCSRVTPWPRYLGHEFMDTLDENAIRHALVEELKTHRDHPNPLTAFKFWSRTRRLVALAPYKLWTPVTRNVPSPFLDDELFDFLNVQRADLFIDRQFNSRVIAKAYPQWASIPYENKIYSKQPSRAFIHQVVCDIWVLSGSRRWNYVDAANIRKRLFRYAINGRGGWWMPKSLLLMSLERGIKEIEGRRQYELPL